MKEMQAYSYTELFDICLTLIYKILVYSKKSTSTYPPGFRVA